jgi:hypothetical protein
MGRNSKKVALLLALSMVMLSTGISSATSYTATAADGSITARFVTDASLTDPYLEIAPLTVAETEAFQAGFGGGGKDIRKEGIPLGGKPAPMVIIASLIAAAVAAALLYRRSQSRRQNASPPDPTVRM